MIEKILKIPLSELKTIRFRCMAKDGKPCDGVIEINIDNIGTAILRCPQCGTELRRTNIDEALKQFGKAFQILNNNDFISLEFVLGVTNEN